MGQKSYRKLWNKYVLGIVLPALLAIILSIGSLYIIIIPSFQYSILESKKEMIQELTNVAWNILLFYEKEEKSGRISHQLAQNQAIEEIKHLRYGTYDEDYFFIIDTIPRMIMHPYSTELNGQDLHDYRDPDGHAIYVEMKKLVEKENSGYLNYTWQTKYNNQVAAPKLSFVKKFEAWQWIIGTDVFLDDVKKKTAQISRQLLTLVFACVILFSILLIIIAHQSFKIEKRRRITEGKLQLSRQKYKALAESATDPMIMIHENKLIYANKSMCSLLDYSSEELKSASPLSLFPHQYSDSKSGRDYFKMAMEGQVPEKSPKGILVAKDGSSININQSFSQIELGNHTAMVMVAKDVRSPHHLHENTGGKEENYFHLTHHMGLGFFRVGGEKNLPLLDTNKTAMHLLNILDGKDKDDLYLIDFFTDANEVIELQNSLKSEEIIKYKTVQMKKWNSDKPSLFSISLTASRNQLGEIRYYDGIIEEITGKKKIDQERENLIVELQTSLLFLNQPIKFSLKNFVSCDLNTSVAQATRIMAKAKQSSILVCSESGEMVGIITDMVLRERVIAENLPYETPVYQVMSSPLISIDESALIFEAVLLMQEKGIKHLVVKNVEGEAVSIISNEELLHIHRYSTAFMLSQIREAQSFEEILTPQTKVPRIVKSLAESGAHAKNITRIITTISDAILEKIIDFTINELGQPPVQFAFISLGSEGRGEQTLVTDQDNALIYEDVSAENFELAESYFRELGKRICTRLDTAGYDFCLGEIMAMNPKWCQPISVWKEYFTKWITEGSPQDLLEVSIFFDFRCIYGESQFTTALRSHIRELVGSSAAFLQHLSHTALSFKAPLDFFGNIHAQNGHGTNSFDIKKVISSIVGFARLYAVREALESVNTVHRIEELHKTDIINTATYEEITEAYDYLMKLRFRHQVSMIDEGKKPNNFINIDSLSHMDKIMLKKAFSQVTSIQKRLSYDFSGMA